MSATVTPSKPRVSIVHPALAPYRIDIFNALAERFDLNLIFLHQNVPYQDYDQERLLKSLRAKYSFLPDGFSLFGRELKLGLWRILRKDNPDVVVTHEFSPVTISVVLWNAFRSQKKGIPHVVWSADSGHVIEKESVFRSIARGLVLRRLDGLILYSDDVAKIYRTRFGYRGMIGVSPNSQKEDSFRAKLGASIEAQKLLYDQFGLVGKKVVLYVGRLVEVKRVDRLINAFSRAVNRNPNTILIIAGDGEEKGTLETLAGRLGCSSSIYFTGHLEGDELMAWFNLGALFILPSDYEPWGAVVNEALLSGMPVICSREIGAAALIEDGVNGAVVNGDHEEKFAGLITSYLEKSSPLGKSIPEVRSSLMNQSFDDVVAGFIYPIANLGAK